MLIKFFKRFEKTKQTPKTKRYCIAKKKFSTTPSKQS